MSEYAQQAESGQAQAGVFDRSRRLFEEVVAGLADPGCGELTHAPLEDQLTERCRELMRSLFQDHAARRQVSVAIVLDFIHILEYLWKAAWSFFYPGDPDAETWESGPEHKLGNLLPEQVQVSQVLLKRMCRPISTRACAIDRSPR